MSDSSPDHHSEDQIIDLDKQMIEPKTVIINEP